MKVREQKAKPQGPVCGKECSFTFPVRAAKEDSWRAPLLPAKEDFKEIAEVGSLSADIIKEVFF